MQQVFGTRDFGALKNLYFVNRDSWGAKDPVRTVPKLPYIPNKITLTFTTKTESCTTLEDCCRIVRGLQEREIAQGEPDITFNFLIGNDGHVYEGRGWEGRAAFLYRDKPEFPDQTLEIGLIGDYEKKKWPYEMMSKAFQLANYGVELKKIDPAAIGGQCSATMPGPLEPPYWRIEDYDLPPECLKEEPSKKPLLVSPEEADRKYKDPLLISKVVHYVRKRTAEQSYEISEIRKIMAEIQSKIVDVEIALTRLDPPQREEEVKDQPMFLNKLNRQEWGSMETECLDKMELMTLPIKKVHLTYSTDTEKSKTPEGNTQIVRALQAKHINNGMPDIAHNFLVGRDGTVLEGRGWFFKPEIALHNPDMSEGTVDVAFIGKYKRDTFPDDLLKFTQDLMFLGVKTGMVAKDYEIMFD